MKTLLPSTCIVLAAGESKRMGDADKMLLPVNGKPLVQYAVDCALLACERVIVVQGAVSLETVVSGHRCLKIVTNSDYREGQLGSLKTGLAHCNTESAFILLGDLPFITPEVFFTVFKNAKNKQAAYPVCSGRRGHPVYLGPDAIGLIISAQPTEKAMDVIKPLKPYAVDVNNPGIYTDTDTLEDYERAKTSFATNPKRA